MSEKSKVIIGLLLCLEPGLSLTRRSPDRDDISWQDCFTGQLVPLPMPVDLQWLASCLQAPQFLELPSALHDQGALERHQHAQREE